MIRRSIILLFALALAGLSPLEAGPAAPLRSRWRLDLGWKFHLGDDWGIGQNLSKAGSGFGPAAEQFGDAGWRTVDLPHDWAVELPFDPRADGAHGFHALGPGFAAASVGWYRRAFALPAAPAGRRIWLEFDGVYRDATVFVNGWCVGRHEGGYNGFRYDITDVARLGGRNEIAVRVDASQFEGWFYEGAGIYRHVWLEETAPLAAAPDGTFVFSVFPGNVPQGPAGLRFHTELRNAGSAPAQATVHWEVRDPAGRKVAAADATAPVPSAGSREIDGAASVAQPELWSPEQPRLYTLITEVSAGGGPVDRTETRFGIRTVAFDPDRGFLLNGRPYVLKGTADHQDHAGVGTALPDRLQYFRIGRLKEMGANAYRTAHNPPTPELLEACDQLGMLVMDENRLLGSDADRMRLWDEQIRRDRNHPSVAIWSLGNEEFSVQSTPEGARVAGTMQAYVQRLDPTRPVTYNAPLGNEYAGINSVIQVRGWSYHIGVGTMDAYHAAHPLQPNVGSEQGSTVGTRGIYANDPARGYVSAYDDGAQSWSNTAEQWWSFFAVRPWLAGGFAWTGFDYRGEPTPYGWPCVSSQFGILDTCGFPKDNFWYYQAWWTDRPVLHLLPHWNWPGREGQPIKVEALSNCDEVELFLNGRSLGRKPMPRYSHLEWTVAYAPGTLAAHGYRGGREVAVARVETTGEPAGLRLTPARPALDADGNDCAVVDVAVVDRQGRVVPTAGNRVAFAVTGPGRLAGVGNGDPSCQEPDVIVGQAPVRSVPIGGWRWHTVADAYVLPPQAAASFDDSSWPSFDPDAETGPVGPTSQAVLRARFRVAAEDLTAPVIELCFGRIAGDARVFVNGREVGSINEPHFAASFDVKAGLRPGENIVAVALANWGVAGGVNRGASLRFQGQPAPLAWSRSVFNGLAQVILRTGRESGSIRLTARSEGLSPAVLDLPVRPADSSSDLP